MMLQRGTGRAVLAGLLTASFATAVGASAAAAERPVVAAPSAPSAADAPRAFETGTTHRVYLVKVLGRGSYTDADTGADNSLRVLPVLDLALRRWVEESAGRITSFRRIPQMRTATLDGPCASGSATWSRVDDEVWPGVDFGSGAGNHLVVMQPRGCGGGVGTVGDSIADGGKMTFAADPFENATTIVHELGHNFGLSHAHAEVCDADGCVDEAYGNDYSPMGSTPRGTVLPPAISSHERARLGLLQRCEVPTLALPARQRSVTATYDVAGRGSATGTRGLRVTDPATGTPYWIDWRHGAGLDARATYVNSPAFRPGVTITARLDATTGQLRTTSRDDDGDSQFSLRAGETFSIGGLRVVARRAEQGQTWSRVTVSLTAIDRAPGPAMTPLRGRVRLPRTTSVGDVLRARTSRWTGGTCHRYQWFDGKLPIAGALASTFTVPPRLRGHRISVRVTGQRTGYRAGRSRSRPAVVTGPSSS